LKFVGKNHKKSQSRLISSETTEELRTIFDVIFELEITEDSATSKI